MPKLDLSAIAPETGSDYPPPHDLPVAARRFRRLADAGAITDFAVNHVELPEGVWSSQRHWHEGEDEFLVVLSGGAMLIDNDGETPLTAGDCVAFPKADGDGHHLIGGPGGCVFVVWGRPEASLCHFPDIDMRYDPRDGSHRHEDGLLY